MKLSLQSGGPFKSKGGLNLSSIAESIMDEEREKSFKNHVAKTVKMKK